MSNLFWISCAGCPCCCPPGQTFLGIVIAEADTWNSATALAKQLCEAEGKAPTSMKGFPIDRLPPYTVEIPLNKLLGKEELRKHGVEIELFSNMTGHSVN